MVGGQDPLARFRRLFLHLAGVAFVIFASFTIRIFWEMREHVVMSLWLGIVGCLSQNCDGFLSLASRSLTAVVTTEGDPAAATESPLASFSPRGVPDQDCVVVDQFFFQKKKTPAIAAWYHASLVSGRGSNRWSDLLLSDRDEKNEVAGTARDGPVFCWSWVSSWLPTVATSSHNRPRDNIECEYSTSLCARRKDFSTSNARKPHCRQGTSCPSWMCSLLRSERPLKNFVLCSSAKAPVHLSDFVVKFPRFVSRLRFLALCPIDA